MNFIKHAAMAAILGAAFVSPSSMANLVSDPGFELDNGSWTASNWSIGNVGRGIHTGSNSIATGCVDPGDLSTFALCTFSQSLATTPGSLYDISFWLYSDGFVDGSAQFPNGLQVSFDGIVVDTILNFPTTNPNNTSIPGGPSTLITINNVLATNAVSTLQFGGFHNPEGIFVDDVSVDPSAVPEPASLALFGLGLAALVFSRRKKPEQLQSFQIGYKNDAMR